MYFYTENYEREMLKAYDCRIKSAPYFYLLATEAQV